MSVLTHVMGRQARAEGKGSLGEQLMLLVNVKADLQFS